MATLMESIIDFIRVRQLNIGLAGLLTLGYLVYQFWGTLFKGQEELENEGHHHSTRLSRSRSRSCSKSRTRSGNYHDYKNMDAKRRGRKGHRRCSDCSLCNFE